MFALSWVAPQQGNVRRFNIDQAHTGKLTFGDIEPVEVGVLIRGGKPYAVPVYVFQPMLKSQAERGLVVTYRQPLFKPRQVFVPLGLCLFLA